MKYVKQAFNNLSIISKRKIDVNGKWFIKHWQKNLSWFKYFSIQILLETQSSLRQYGEVSKVEGAEATGVLLLGLMSV